jgi:hypothetical protein
MSITGLSLRVHPDVVDAELDDGEVALLHLESKMYYSLNATAARIWIYLRQGLPVDQVCRRLQQEFGLDSARAERSVGSLIADLTRYRLLQQR